MKNQGHKETRESVNQIMALMIRSQIFIFGDVRTQFYAKIKRYSVCKAA